MLGRKIRSQTRAGNYGRAAESHEPSCVRGEDARRPLELDVLACSARSSVVHGFQESSSLHTGRAVRQHGHKAYNAAGGAPGSAGHNR